MSKNHKALFRKGHTRPSEQPHWKPVRTVFWVVYSQNTVEVFLNPKCLVAISELSALQKLLYPVYR